MVTRSKIETIILNETEYKSVIEEIFDEELNKTINKTKRVKINKTESRVVGVESLGLSVYNAPLTNIRKGLDLQGGTRVDRKSTRLNSSHTDIARMPSSA